MNAFVMLTFLFVLYILFIKKFIFQQNFTFKISQLQSELSSRSRYIQEDSMYNLYLIERFL